MKRKRDVNPPNVADMEMNLAKSQGFGQPLVLGFRMFLLPACKKDRTILKIFRGEDYDSQYKGSI